MKQHLEVSRTDDAVTLTPPSYLVGGDETRELESAMQKEIAEGGRHLILDFRRVEFMDSSALAVIIAAYTGCTKVGRRMFIQNSTPRIKSILSIMKLDALMPENTNG